MSGEIDQFFAELMQQVYARADVSGQFAEDAFFDITTELLVETGDLESAERSRYEGTRGVRIDGYSGDPLNEDNILSLILVDFDQSTSPATMSGKGLQAGFKRARSFAEKSLDPRFRESMEETTPAYGLADLISKRWSSIRKIRIILVSNRLLGTRIDAVAASEIDGRPVTHSVWDVGRMYRYVVVGRSHDPLEIDLHDFGGPLPALPAHMPGAGYEAYLVAVPASQLAGIYERWGTRLLEQNVRVFLQARGAVNKGIKVTLENSPEMFFAYNNGITATATAVRSTQSNGRILVGGISNLQIVNGGQTTASIHAAHLNNVPLDRVFVQMKLSIIDPAKAEEVVPKISEYANTQNKVSAADFFSNHPFHVRIEQHSRRTYAPSPEGSLRQSKWFYERARGQYQDARARLTAGKRKEFDLENPRAQLITKTDLAKFMRVWDGHPHIVARGAQKNFLEFAQEVTREWDRDPDQFSGAYFREGVSKAIIFKAMEKLVMAQSWYGGGYRAQIVAYGIAKLSEDLKSRGRMVDFERVWRAQGIDDELAGCLASAAKPAHNVIMNPPPGIANLSEWAKQQGCWARVQSTRVTWPAAMSRLGVPIGEYLRRQDEGAVDQAIVTGIQLQTIVVSAGGAFWSDLRSWARVHSRLSPAEAGVLETCARIPGRVPSEKQCMLAVKVYERARSDGFQGELPGHNT